MTRGGCLVAILVAPAALLLWHFVEPLAWLSLWWEELRARWNQPIEDRGWVDPYEADWRG